MSFLDGRKTKIGAILIGAGMVILENPELITDCIPGAGPWIRLIGSIVFGTGASTGLIGLAGKLEKLARSSVATKTRVENKPADGKKPEVDRVQIDNVMAYLRSKGYEVRRVKPSNPE